MKTKDMMYAALFTAFVAVLGYIPAIPLQPVPVTLQTMGVMLSGAVLGARLGGLSMLVLVLLAFVGAPVLTGGNGGLGYLLGPTGGYVFSFPVAAYVIGYFTEKNWTQLKVWKSLIINIFGGIIIVYSIGMPYLMAVTKMDFTQAFILNLQFIPGDLIKAFLAAFIAVKIKKTYPIIRK